MNNENPLSGIFLPLVTPFIKEKIDLKYLQQNIQKYNQTNTNGYMILGGNGEYLGLTEKEALRVVDTVVRVKANNKTAVVGTGRESAYATVEFIKRVAAVGAEFASIITPFYYAKLMNGDALVRYYLRIADESPIPVIVYNSPEYAAGVKVSVQGIAELSHHPNIAGMKNSSNESMKNYIGCLAEESRFVIHVGRILRLFDGLQEGAVGATLAIANYLPELCSEAYYSFRTGDQAKSKAICEQLTRINQFISPHGVPGVKCAMDWAGFHGCETRLPLLPLSREKRMQIREILFDEGLIKSSTDYQ